MNALPATSCALRLLRSGTTGATSWIGLGCYILPALIGRRTSSHSQQRGKTLGELMSKFGPLHPWRCQKNCFECISQRRGGRQRVTFRLIMKNGRVELTLPQPACHRLSDGQKSGLRLLIYGSIAGEQLQLFRRHLFDVPRAGNHESEVEPCRLRCSQIGNREGPFSCLVFSLAIAVHSASLAQLGLA